jgi:serine/threonine-protein kinase
VSIWDKLFKKNESEAKPAPVPTAPVPAPEPVRLPPDVERLAQIGAPDGPTEDEALGLFRHVRTTPDEGLAIAELLRRKSQTALPEGLLVAVASALADRGENDAALATLADCESSVSLLLRADLTMEPAAALALVERVLLRELDHPGARERHARLRQALGLVAPSRISATTTTVVTAEPDTPYRLLREIARGGAGAVYEAEDRDLGRHVALKVYHEPTRDREQLVHEARVAVALAGAGVVRIYDVDPDHGWIALEYASLGALREQIRKKNADVLARADEWALALAITLARVHDAGWVHLDVKPANVLLLDSSHGEGALPILTDFGIARRLGEKSPHGSMGYVSPERMAGRGADPKDDVYGFGRILEDVLDASGADSPLRSLAKSCTGPDANRPAHARELVMRLRAR